MNSSFSRIENFINKYNPGSLSLLHRLSGAIENSELELARVTLERNVLENELERVTADAVLLTTEVDQ